MQQRERDALFTIGRLARLGVISFYTYLEVNVELWRGGRGRMPFLNAFEGCAIKDVAPAVERSRFQQTSNMEEWFAKGSNQDARRFTQTAFLSWLASLTRAQVETFLSLRERSPEPQSFRLTDFEIESLKDLDWFQSLCRGLGFPTSVKNLVDAFHLFTARRNGLEIFLTLEITLPNALKNLQKRRVKTLDMNVAVLRPLELLEKLHVKEIDPVPVETDRFYTYAEIARIGEELRRLR